MVRLFVPVVVLAALLLLLAFALGAAVRGGVRRFDRRRYKPRAAHRRPDTPFDDAAGAGAAPGGPDADAPTDFFTGAPLDADVAIVRCDDCRALYHPDTVAMLAEHNGGRCASCGGLSLNPLGRPRRAARADRGRALVVEPSTAEAFATAIGRLVTVEVQMIRALPAAPGAVPTLLGRTGGGIELRLAFVGPAVRGRRGRAHVLGLLGSRVRARGLLLADEAHGLKLLATEPSMVVELA